MNIFKHSKGLLEFRAAMAGCAHGRKLSMSSKSERLLLSAASASPSCAALIWMKTCSASDTWKYHRTMEA